jgi:hypothetical protein
MNGLHRGVIRAKSNEMQQSSGGEEKQIVRINRVIWFENLKGGRHLQRLEVAGGFRRRLD